MGRLSAIALLLACAGLAVAVPANLPKSSHTHEVHQLPSNAYTTSQTYNCQCRPGQLWLDLIYVVDTSKYMTQLGFLDSIDYIEDIMDVVNIQPNNYVANQFFTRAGVISYDSNVTTWATVGQTNATTFDKALDNIVYTRSSTTNMLLAIQAASKQFDNNPSTNSNRRKVMVIVTAVYNPNGEASPLLAADDFKARGGIIIVFNVIAGAGVPDPDLIKVASPGMYIDSRTPPNPQNPIAPLTLGLCNANCFCGNNFVSPAQDPRGGPVGGCFYTSGTPLSYPAASTNCNKMGHDGIVSLDQDDATSTFLRTFDQPNGWIGLQYNQLQNVYLWADGTQWTGSRSIFINYQPPTAANKLYCVGRIETPVKTNWTQSVCTGTSRPFICQLSPCDTMRFCGNNDF